MKVPISEFEAHLLPFMKKIADTMPTSLHKWLAGAMIASGMPKMRELASKLTDKDGMVDVDKLRSLVNSGFETSGGEVVIPFGNDGLSLFGVKPVNVKLSKADLDQFFTGFVR